VVVKGGTLPQFEIQEDFPTPPKGGGLPVHAEYVYTPPPPSPDDSAERRKSIFDWPKRKNIKKD